jgi:hypothetical protein
VKSSVLLGIWGIPLSISGWGRNTLQVWMVLLSPAGKLSHNVIDRNVF